MKLVLIAISVFFVSAPARAAQAQPQASVGSTKIDRTIGVCHLINNPPLPPLTAANVISPTGSVWSYLQRENLIPEQLTDEMFSTAKATLLQGAGHGELKVTASGNYRYHPTPDYLGTDRATFLVEMGGYKVKVVYHFQMISGGLDEKDGPGSYEDKKNCPNGEEWKISLNPDDPNAVSYIYDMPSQLASAYASPTLRSRGTPQKRGAP